MPEIGQRIKVLHLVEDLKIGGLERIVETIVGGLDRGRYEPSIWCIAGGGRIADRLAHGGKDVKVLNLRTYHNPLNIINLAFLMRKGGFEIVHTHGYFASTMGRISAVFARTPVILSHVHTTYWGFTKRNLWVERALSRVTDRIICCSEAVRDFVVRKEKVEANKVLTIYNGIRCEEDADGRLKGNEGGRRVMRIVVTASLVRNKGHRYLLNALKKVVDRGASVSLSIVGDGPMKWELVQHARSLGIVDHIEFLGTVENVQAVLRESDVFVLPTVEREGLGVAIIEAMCQSKPVIATEIGGIPEAVQDGVNGYLVKPRDAGSLAERLLMLLSDAEQRERMGRAGRRRFKERFDADIMLGKIEATYEVLLEEKGIVRV